MPLTLKKPVYRCTAGSYNVLRSGLTHRRPIVIGLCAGDLIEFRELRRRCRFTLPIDSAFRLAVRIATEAARRERAEQRRQAK